MTVAEIDSCGGNSVRDRLIRAADLEVSERGIDGVRIDAVAARAGVSRATVFRQLGSISEVLVQVALLRAQRHIAAVHQLMSTRCGAFAKIEAALVYTARELPTDPALVALIAGHSASLHHPRVHQAAVGVMGPVLREGQRCKEIRADIELDDLVDFLVEQTYVAAEEVDRSQAAVAKRFRRFVVPALEARHNAGGEFISRANELDNAISAASEALESLRGWLRRSDNESPP